MILFMNLFFYYFFKLIEHKVFDKFSKLSNYYKFSQLLNFGIYDFPNKK